MSHEIHMQVHTENGVEMRPVENLARLVNFRGVPEYVREPVLKPGEEIYRTADGECRIVKTAQESAAFVTELFYAYDHQQVKRTIVYSDGNRHESFVPGMPTQEEVRKEAADYSVFARMEFP